MTTRASVTVLFRGVGVLILCLLPLADAEGTLWLLAIVAAITVYEGARAPVVYSMLAIVLAVELIYGADIGVSSLGYLGAVALFSLARRFVSIPAWAAQEGWHIVDAFRASLCGVLLYLVNIVLSIVIGNILFGYGNILLRIQGLSDVHEIVIPLILCSGTFVVVRRMAMPFRREILFGL